jgi:acyl-CoA hydrolase
MLVDGLLHLRRADILTREVDGAVTHAAFFLGTRDFYRALREMPEGERAKFQMRAVSFTNQLYGDEKAKVAARVNARFVNSTMIATLLGEAISDTLDSGQVVSGVGGQHNFVEQAFALPGARSILALKATRMSGRKLMSNIRWSAGRVTIPRHLRDIFVTEYGVADLRGKPDAECIAAMLAIADSRFQPELLQQAKATGKIAKTYEIPAPRRNNTPGRISAALESFRDRGLLPLFPFGTDLTPTEQQLVPVLAAIQEASASTRALAALLISGLRLPAAEPEALARLALLRPRGLRNRAYKLLIQGAMNRRKM